MGARSAHAHPRLAGGGDARRSSTSRSSTCSREQLFFDEEVDLVGISASTPRIKAAYALADLYRAKGVKVVLGGHHVTAMPDEALDHADAVVIGEGEPGWRRVCDDFLTNPSRVHGIYRDDPPDLAELPQPRMDLMHIERYGAFYYPLIASRGCPEACTFCFAKRMTRGYRTYPISHVLEQVRRRPKFVRACYFVDDNLPADPDYSRELFQALAKTGIKFGMQARHEFSKDPDNLKMAQDAGCLLISSGYESVNQMSLDGTAKHATVDGYREVISNIFKAGIIPSGQLDVRLRLGHARHLPPDAGVPRLHRADALQLHHRDPLPRHRGVEEATRARAACSPPTTTSYVGKDHVVVKPKQMTPEQLTDGIRWLAREYYSFARCTKRGLHALENKAIEGFGPQILRAPALMGLNYFQWWQWHYRMVPSVQWLYQRLVSVNRFQYVKDFTRRSNYWSSEHQAAGGPAHEPTESPFHSCQGFKKGPAHPLVPEKATPSWRTAGAQHVADPVAVVYTRVRGAPLATSTGFARSFRERRSRFTSGASSRARPSALTRGSHARRELDRHRRGAEGARAARRSDRRMETFKLRFLDGSSARSFVAARPVGRPCATTSSRSFSRGR